METILASHDFFRTKSPKNSTGANICPKTAWELSHWRKTESSVRLKNGVNAVQKCLDTSSLI